MRLASYDPLDSSVIADPYPILARFQREEPVSWHGGMQSWLLTRYADCMMVLRDHSGFARDLRRAGQPVPTASLSVQSLDPPEQTPVRSMFMRVVNSTDLDMIEAQARQLVEAKLDEVGAHEPFDVMTVLAAPLAVMAISEVLGIQVPDSADFVRLSDEIMRSMDGGLDPSLVEPGRLARERLAELVEGWVRLGNRADVLSGAPPGQEEFVRNTVRVMFQGGYSTMVAALGNVVHTVFNRRDVLSAMRDPNVLRSGIDELVRFDGPVQGTSRIAMKHCEIGGVAVRPGETVTTLFAAANRDPRQFADPDRLQLERSPNQHLGFGWGTHACIGTVPARLTLRALIASLSEYPRQLVAAGEPQRRRTATMRVFATLPAALTPTVRTTS